MVEILTGASGADVHSGGGSWEELAMLEDGCTSCLRLKRPIVGDNYTDQELEDCSCCHY
jgi:hypothetical protein